MLHKKLVKDVYIAAQSSHSHRLEVPMVNAYLLTNQEHKVLQLICYGFSNKEIGSALFIAPSTVGEHVHSILAKMHVRNRAAAAAEGVRQRLVK